MADLFDEPRAMERTATNGRKVAPPMREAARYAYCDRAGEVISTTTRPEPIGITAGRSKEFRWDRGNPHVLYRLPEIVEADHVWLGEGEKGADRMASILPPGHAATCTPAPTSKEWPAEFTPMLAGKSVTIVVDRDDSGVKQARVAFEALRSAGVSVRCVQAAVTTEKADAFDHFEAGFGLDDFVPLDLHDATPYRLVPIGEIRPAIDSDFIVKGGLDRGQLGAVIGAPGSSKTFFTLDLAIAPASGAPWRGHRTRRARVVYVASEGARGIQNRIEAMRLRKAFGDPRLISFFVVADVVRLTVDSEDIDRLVESVRAVVGREGVDLIVIDTLSRSIAGLDENSSEAMTGAVAAADRLRTELGAAVLLVHHQGKDESRGARGHSSLKAALDVEIEVKKLGGDTFSATLSKSRDYETGRTWLHRLEPVEIGTDADGDAVTSCVVVPESGAEPARSVRLNVNEQRTHEALRSLLGVAVGTSFETPEAVPKADLHDYVEKRCGVSRDLRRGVVRKGLEGLKKKNLVAVEGDRVFLLGGDA